MAKLQEVKRKNGTVVYHINIPVNVVKAAELKKADNLYVKADAPGKLVIVKLG